MKKTLFTLSLVFFMGMSLFASKAEMFKLDYDAVQQEFTELNTLVDMIQANPDLTYSSLSLTNADMVEHMNLMPNTAIPLVGRNVVLGIPSFWWGCALGLVGVGIVYFLTDQDSDQAKKALLGCIVNSAAYFVLYFLVIGASVAAGG